MGTSLDVADNLTLGGGGERVPALREDLHHVVSEVAASKVEAEDGVRQRVALCRSISGESGGSQDAKVRIQVAPGW